MRPIGAIIESVWEHPAIRFSRSVVFDIWISAMVILSLEAVWWILKQAALMGTQQSD
jgi:hypothetical protein